LGSFHDDDVIQQSANSVLAQGVFESRRQRVRIFGTGLFADPAYDILLYMFIKLEAKEPVSALRLCVAADVPESTALRHIRLLVANGYLERMVHPNDKRIVNLRLTSIGFKLVAGWLTRIGSGLNANRQI
jgi:hypothetical protein